MVKLATGVVAVLLAASLSASAAEGYRLGRGDVLDIGVWREPEMQKQVVVRPDGAISFPLVGDLPAAGRTVAELKEAIEKALDRYIPDAVASVAVVNAVSMQVAVEGRVARPGRYPITGATTFLEAMALAGGPTPFGNERKVRVRHAGEWRTVDYRKVARGEAEDFALERGDVIYVP
ncbi:MAG: polysaccharide export protein [Nitrospirae bacterium]|nr:MAG: polysaccharide export protein [Nitrospirota bacterium]